jgi:hypothetical protein
VQLSVIARLAPRLALLALSSRRCCCVAPGLPKRRSFLVILHESFDTGVKINRAMPQLLEVMFKRIFAGWAVVLSDGREVARFRGPFARARARRLVFG